MQKTRVPSLGQEDSLDDQKDSCLDNSMDREAWWATVHGVTKESDMTEQLYNKYIFLDIETVSHRVKKKLIPKTQPIGLTEICD